MSKTNQIEKNVKRRIKIKKRIGTIVLAVILLFLVNVPDSLIARVPDKVTSVINLAKQYVPASVVGMLDLIFILMIVFSLLSILINRIALARSTEDYDDEDDEDYEENRRKRKEEKRAEREAAERKKRQEESRRKEQEKKKKSSSNKKRDDQRAKQQAADKKADRERKEEQRLAKERERERERMRNREPDRERESEPPRQRTTTAASADRNTDGYADRTTNGMTRQPRRAAQQGLLTKPVEQGSPMGRKQVSVNTLQEELQVEDILADTQKELGSVASVEDDNFLKNDVAEIMKNL